MPSVGSHLRELRQERGVSLEEMARITRVGLRYLEALEADDYGALPAPVFTRGFIRAYCQALREPPAEALALYPTTESTRAAGGHAPSDGHAPPAVTEAESGSRGTVFVSFVLLVVFGLGLFGLTLVLQSGKEDAAERRVAAPSATISTEPRPAPSPRTPAVPPSPSPAPATPAPPTAPTARPGETATPPASSTATGTTAPVPAPRAVDGAQPPAPAATSAAAAPPPSTTSTANPLAAGPQAEIARLVASVSSPYRLVARASEPTWVRVRMGDGRAVEETLAANEVREWVSNQPFVLTIGNAGGISLELNGRVLPSLGARGVVVGRIVIPPLNEAAPAPVTPAPGQ